MARGRLRPVMVQRGARVMYTLVSTVLYLLGPGVCGDRGG